MNPQTIKALREDQFHIITELDGDMPQYDALFMFQVLEHLLDPYSFLKLISPHIQPGGVLIISTPVTPSCVAFTGNPFLFPPHHQWLPTVQAFNFLAERLGLTCETVLHDPPSPDQVSYTIRKWCGGLPYSPNNARYWAMIGRLALKLATIMRCDWAKIGISGMVVLRKPPLLN